MMMETYLRRGERCLQRMALDPGLRRLGEAALWGGGGFLLSAASIAGSPQPVALGLITAASGWRPGVMSLGAMAGYAAFWGREGSIGILWSAAGGLLASLVGRLDAHREQPMMLPILTAFLAAVTEVCFFLILGDRTPLAVRLARVGLALFFSMLFAQALHAPDSLTRWMAGGTLVLGVAPVRLWGVGLGEIAAGALAASAPFPAAVLAGLGLDLARSAAVSMTAVQCLAWFLRQAPWPYRWQLCLMPALGYLGVSLAWGVRDMGPLPGLVIGGLLGPLVPGSAPVLPRRGSTGPAQVRLALGAQVMGLLQGLVLDMEAPPIDALALVEKARDLACSGCSLRKYCRAVFTAELLQNPLEADCRKQARLLPELRRAQDHYRLLLADRERRREYRTAMSQQYRFLGEYLHHLSGQLPRGMARTRPQFRIQAAARSRGKEKANGDTCVAFPGQDCCFYVLLCDGMGTGLGAAQAGRSAAVLLRRLLGAGFPPEHSLSTVNSLLALGGRAGAVTMDLAQVHLDSGLVSLYKWGAAPSFLLTRAGTEKIGTATFPPGLDLGRGRMAARKLSLRRGETLILLSDGLDGEEVLGRAKLTPDGPPGELAAKILEAGGGNGEDDATAAAIRLTPTAVAPS